MVALSEKDIIWKSFVSNESKDVKEKYLKKLIENHERQSKDKWLGKEMRAHSKQIVIIAKAELDKL